MCKNYIHLSKSVLRPLGQAQSPEPSTAFPYKNLLSKKINERIFLLFQTCEFILLGR